MELSNGGWVRVPDALGGAMGEAAGAALPSFVILAALLALLALLTAIGGAARRRSGRRGRRRDGWSDGRRGGPQRPWQPVVLPGGSGEDRPVRDRAALGAEQMRAVEAGAFETTPLLNRSEARWLPVLEEAARAAGQGHRVMAQVALNEVIRPVGGSADGALGAIVAKRLDFAIVDARWMVALAVEYQGKGHWGDHAALRDAVKREALRKAGVRLVQIEPDSSEAWVRATVAEALGAAESRASVGAADPAAGGRRSRSRNNPRPSA